VGNDGHREGRANVRGGGVTIPVTAGTVTVRCFGGAKIAAGTPAESVPVSEGATVDDVVASLVARHGDALAPVLAVASVLLDEVAVRDRATMVPDGAVLDVLPPVTGG